VQLHLRFIHFTPVAADLVILAINTGKITAAEKHITNTIRTADNRFFAMMNADRTDIEAGITPAYANLAMQPIGIAVSRADVARCHWFKQDTQAGLR
jgi:hypothetical protein